MPDKTRPLGHDATRRNPRRHELFPGTDARGFSMPASRNSRALVMIVSPCLSNSAAVTAIRHRVLGDDLYPAL